MRGPCRNKIRDFLEIIHSFVIILFVLRTHAYRVYGGLQYFIPIVFRLLGWKDRGIGGQKLSSVEGPLAAASQGLRGNLGRRWYCALAWPALLLPGPAVPQMWHFSSREGAHLLGGTWSLRPPNTCPSCRSELQPSQPRPHDGPTTCRFSPWNCKSLFPVSLLAQILDPVHLPLHSRSHLPVQSSPLSNPPTTFRPQATPSLVYFPALVMPFSPSLLSITASCHSL